jgi:hypothetical protein
MKKIIATVAVLMFLLALSAPLAFAQATSTQPAAQDAAAEEAAAYKAWYDAYTAKDNAKRVELGKAFITKFPNSKNATYVKTDVAMARGLLLNAAVQAKNVPEIIRLTKEAMADDPENADYPYFLSIQLQTIDTNYQYEADRVQAAQTGIQTLEAGKPFKLYKDVKKNEALAYFHNALALVEDHHYAAAMAEYMKFSEADRTAKEPKPEVKAALEKGSPYRDKALEHYERAAMSDPMNASYFFNCGRLHQARYNAASNEYLKFPDADRQAADLKPEVKAALDKANAEADHVINCWARFLGLPKNDFAADVKQKVQGALTELYKYRNNGSDAGLAQLIEANKTSPTPVKMTPPVETKPPTAEQKPADQSATKPGNGQPAAASKPATKKPRM